MPVFSNNTEIAIIGLVLWALTLLIALASYRSILTVFTEKSANSFVPTGLDLKPFGRRLTRAHANAYEFIPFALAIMIFAVATNQTQVTDGLAVLLFACRIGQSFVHLVSTSPVASIIRFIVFFVPQVAIVVWWCVKLL